MTPIELAWLEDGRIHKHPAKVPNQSGKHMAFTYRLVSIATHLKKTPHLKEDYIPKESHRDGVPNLSHLSWHQPHPHPAFKALRFPPFHRFPKTWEFLPVDCSPRQRWLTCVDLLRCMQNHFPNLRGHKLRVLIQDNQSPGKKVTLLLQMKSMLLLLFWWRFNWGFLLIHLQFPTIFSWGWE